MKRIQEWIKKRKDANNSGYSLVELVVAIGVLGILSATGVFYYSGITNGAQKTATDNSAIEVYVAVLSANDDDNDDTDPQKIVEKYNSVRNIDPKKSIEEQKKDNPGIYVTLLPETTTKTIGVKVENNSVSPEYTVTKGNFAK